MVNPHIIPIFSIPTWGIDFLFHYPSRGHVSQGSRWIWPAFFGQPMPQFKNGQAKKTLHEFVIAVFQSHYYYGKDTIGILLYIYIYTCMYTIYIYSVHIYIYTHAEYIYIYICSVCIYIYTYIYTYMYKNNTLSFLLLLIFLFRFLAGIKSPWLVLMIGHL